MIDYTDKTGGLVPPSLKGKAMDKIEKITEAVARFAIYNLIALIIFNILRSLLCL